MKTNFNFVYSKRKKYLIILRKIINRMVNNIIKMPSGTINNIVVFPQLINNSESLEILNKLSFAFPENSDINISFLSYEEDLENKILKNKLENHHLYYQKGQTNILFFGNKHAKRLLKEADLIVIHNFYSLKNFRLLNNRKKIAIVDKSYYSMTESNFLKFSLNNYLSKNNKEALKELSRENYKNFINANNNKTKSYLFLTGPSLKNYKKINFEKNSLKIVCNTIVKDEELLNYIEGPDLITFADPVFHFSTNKYSHEFRQLVINCVKKYNCYVAVPSSTVALLVYNYPILMNRVIGFAKSDKINFPTIKEQSVKPSGSIISFLMLPIAISLTHHIHVIGADGRKPNENYFWKHNPNVQLSYLMNTVFESHPSFFRDRIYTDHYKEHCDYLEEIINVAEEEKKSQIFSLTKSYVPVLSNRYYGNDHHSNSDS